MRQIDPVIRHVMTVAAESEHIESTSLMSAQGRIARAALANMHPQLPVMVATLSKTYRTLGAAPDKQPVEALKIADIAYREIAASGTQEMSTLDLGQAIQRSNTALMIREAAGHELELRGRPNADDFLGLKAQLQGTETPGKTAHEYLANRRLDVTAMFGRMSDQELGAIHAGAYDRVRPENRDALANSLGTSMQNVESSELARVNQAVTQTLDKPVMHHPQRQHAFTKAPVRQPTFGRRMAAVQADNAIGM